MKLEQTILKNLIYNEDYLRKVLPFLKEEYFSDRTDKTLYNEITSFTETYNSTPTIEALALAVKEKRNLTNDEVESCETYLEEIEKTNDFAKPYKTDFINKDKKVIGYYRQTQASGPANGINSNIIDLSKWVICQLSKGKYNNTNVIPSSVIQETMKPLNISTNSIRDKELSYELYGMGRTMTTYKNHLMTLPCIFITKVIYLSKLCTKAINFIVIEILKIITNVIDMFF